METNTLSTLRRIFHFDFCQLSKVSKQDTGLFPYFHFTAERYTTHSHMGGKSAGTGAELTGITKLQMQTESALCFPLSDKQ